MCIRWIAGSATLAALFVATAVSAEEQTLHFRVVLTKMSVTPQEVANLPGRTMILDRAVGVAIFDDGRIAYKVTSGTSDGTAEEGSYAGYATYTFESGDSMTVRYHGNWPSEAGGSFEVISGTGAYAAATGTGNFHAVPDPWENAEINEGTFTINIPNS